MELEIIPVTGQIKLGQFLKLANLVEDGANATIAIQSGDKVLVDLPTGVVGAQVG